MNVIGMQGIVGGTGFSVSPSSSSPFNNGGGTKRPLASCREELERSWQTLAGGSPSSSSSSSMSHGQYLRLVSHNGNSGIVEESDDDMVVHGRSKRRRTGLASSTIISTDDCMDGAVADATMDVNTTQDGLCKDVRISPDNRPAFAMIVDSTTSTTVGSSNNNNKASSLANRPPIKAGWYKGTLSVNGHRHGH
eukprot:scaffold14118_cov73-Skeletonema_marinoi.AAC.1